MQNVEAATGPAGTTVSIDEAIVIGMGVCRTAILQRSKCRVGINSQVESWIGPWISGRRKGNVAGDAEKLVPAGAHFVGPTQGFPDPECAGILLR